MGRHCCRTVLAGVALSLAALTASFSTIVAQTSWRGLVVAPEVRCSPYDADDYRYPQSVEDQIVAQLGDVYGPYTGRWFASDRETDIEHIVARSEAHDSGLCTADGATRRRFASDLLNLTLAAPSVNRNQKRDRDGALLHEGPARVGRRGPHFSGPTAGVTLQG